MKPFIFINGDIQTYGKTPVRKRVGHRYLRIKYPPSILHAHESIQIQWHALIGPGRRIPSHFLFLFEKTIQQWREFV
jgi:hypothetical protein